MDFNKPRFDRSDYGIIKLLGMIIWDASGVDNPMQS